MIGAAPANRLAPCDPLTLENERLVEIGVGGAETSPVVDGHRPHIGNFTGERDVSSVRSTNRRPQIHCKINAPVTREATDGRKVAYHCAFDGSIQTGASAGWEDKQHGKEKKRDGYSFATAA